jgi:hypothetical protein
MQQVISKSHVNKDNNKIKETQKIVNKINQWLDKIGKTLNISQLSNYK